MLTIEKRKVLDKGQPFFIFIIIAAVVVITTVIIVIIKAAVTLFINTVESVELNHKSEA